MKPVTQAQFARLMEVDRSHVTRLKQHGRLVLTDAGLVDVEASRQKILDTSGGRDDVAARWAAQRGMEVAEGQPPTDRRPTASTRGNGGNNAETTGGTAESRIDAQARKEAAAADLLEMEREQKRGNLIPKEDVDAALKAMGAAVRSAMEIFPDQVAPIVAPVPDLEEVHSLLAQACRDVLAGIEHSLARYQAELPGGGA
jgi:phage terminase Nu1 subunit (DNA packaging protein)